MRILLALVAVPFVACVEPALQVHPTNNENVDVELLFTHDGCNVYRFKDGQYHYFVKCTGDATAQQTLSLVKCGKSCSYDEIIATVTAGNP